MVIAIRTPQSFISEWEIIKLFGEFEPLNKTWNAFSLPRYQFKIIYRARNRVEKCWNSPQNLVPWSSIFQSAQYLWKERKLKPIMFRQKNLKAKSFELIIRTACDIDFVINIRNKLCFQQNKRYPNDIHGTSKWSK